MNSICFFSTYFRSNRIPYYVKCYLTELARHFNEVILISACKDLLESDKQFLFEKKINYMLVENEGFDFGMWSKAFNAYDVNSYDRVGLVNDSCILFKKLDDVFETIDKNDWDYCGILDSEQIAYHIQSFFVVINKRAIPYVAAYFKQQGIMATFDDLIKIYEVGLTQFLVKNNLKIGSVFSYQVTGKSFNPSFSGIEKLILANFPLIKKKIIFGTYRPGELRHLGKIDFNINPVHYMRFIQEHSGNLIINFNDVKKDYHYTAVATKLFIYSVFFDAIKKMRRIKRKIINGE